MTQYLSKEKTAEMFSQIIDPRTGKPIRVGKSISFNSNVYDEITPLQQRINDQKDYIEGKNPIRMNLQVLDSIPTVPQSMQSEWEETTNPQKDWYDTLNVASPDEIQQWREKGKMGFGETAQRIFTLQSLAEKIPFLGTTATMGMSADMLWSIDRLKNNKQISDTEKDLLVDYLRNLKEIQVRGTTLASDVLTQIAESVPFAVEFGLGLAAIPATSGGSATFSMQALSKIAARKAAKKAIQDEIKRLSVESTMTGIKKNISGATTKQLFNKAMKDYALGGTMQTAKIMSEAGAKKTLSTVIKNAPKDAMRATIGSNPLKYMSATRFANNIADRQLSGNMYVTDAGEGVFTQPENIAISIMKALGTTVFDNYTETIGFAFSPLGNLSKWFAKPVRKVLPHNFYKNLDNIVNSKFGMKATEAFQKYGYDGVLEEMGEELVNRFLCQTFGINGLDEYNIDGFLNNVLYWNNPMQWATEALSFAAMSGAGHTIYGASSALKKWSENREIASQMNEYNSGKRNDFEKKQIKKLQNEFSKYLKRNPIELSAKPSPKEFQEKYDEAKYNFLKEQEKKNMSAEEFYLEQGVIKIKGSQSEAERILRKKLKERGVDKETINDYIQSSSENQIREDLKKLVIEDSQKSSEEMTRIDKKQNEVTDRAYNMLIRGGVKTDVAWANAKLFGVFYKNYGSNNDKTFDKWFDKLNIQYNIPLSARNENVPQEVLEQHYKLYDRTVPVYQTLNGKFIDGEIDRLFNVLGNDIVSGTESHNLYGESGGAWRNIATDNNEIFTRANTALSELEKEKNIKLENAKTEKQKQKIEKDFDIKIKKIHESFENSQKQIQNRIEELRKNVQTAKNNAYLQANNITNFDGSVVEDVTNPLAYDYLNNQITGEKINIELNTDIKVEKIEPQEISSSLPFEISQKPSNNKKALIQSNNVNNGAKVEVVNKNTNEIGIINKATIEKSLSNLYQVDKNYADKIAILNNIQDVFKTAQLIISHSDTKKDTSIKIKRYANIASVGGKNYLLEIVGKDKGELCIYSINSIDKKNDGNQKRLENSQQLDTVNNSIAHIQNAIKSKLVQKYNNDYQNAIKNNKSQNVLFQSATTAGAETSAEISDAQKEWQEKGTESKYFKKWFGDSKVVDENSKPKLLTDNKDIYITDGYSNNGISRYSYKGSHRSPSYSGGDVQERLENSEDVNLFEVAQGYHNQPDDYFSPMGARYYMYDDKEGLESARAVRDVIAKIKNGKENITVKIYRAVPADVVSDKLKNGDWVTLSKSYAIEHGEQYLDGEYKIIEKEVPINEVWWDGNDLREWGYDNGKEQEADLYLKIENPKYQDVLPANWKEARELRNQGYDGIITPKGEYLVFEKTQIKSVDNRGTFDESNPNIYYQGANTNYREQLEDTKNNLEYKKFVDKVFSGELSQKEKAKPFHIGKTPAKLVEAGLPENNVAIGYKVIEKAKNNKNADHNLSKETISEVWNALKNPIAVIKAEQNENEKKENNRYSAILDLQDDNGKYVLVAIEVDKNIGSGIIVNDIRSIHSRKSYEPIIDKALNDKRLLKFDAEKIRNLLLGNTNSILESGQASSKSIIADLINKSNPKRIGYVFQEPDTNESSIEENDNLIAGYSYQEVMNKLSSLYDELDKISSGKEQKNIMSKIHVLEDAFEMFENSEKYSEKQISDTALNAYYVMNNQNLPEEFIETDQISQRTYSDLLKAHNEKKEKEINTYYGYFSEGQNKNIITIMSNSNESTALHELGHLFLNGLNELAKTSEEARQQLAEVNKWLGCNGGEYTIKQQEKFARSFEAYLYKGKAPNNKLRQVFENFKEWLKSVYKDITELVNQGADISDEVQNLFDKMFGNEKYYQNQKEISELIKKVNQIGKRIKEKNKKPEENTEQLDETAKRHKEVSYEILSIGTGKSIKYLKSIFETNSSSKSIIKKREKIEELLDKVEDKITAAGGMQPEWLEFYSDTGVNYSSDDVHASYKLVEQALNTIINKSYGGLNLDNRLSELAEYYENNIETANLQYDLLISEFKKGNRDVALTAIYEWLDQLDNQIKQDYENKIIYDMGAIERDENANKFDIAKRKILQKAMELEQQQNLKENEKYKETVKEIMKNLDFLQPTDKAKITANIFDVPSVNLLMHSLDGILDVAKTMEDVNFRRKLDTEIHKELQTTKNVKKNGRSVGKYDYKSNKLFEELRKLDRLSTQKANDLRLDMQSFAQAEDEGLSFKDKLINKFISYKADGRTYANTELMKSIYDDIIKIKLVGKCAKSEMDLNEKLSESKDIDKLINIVQKKDKPNFALKGYINWFGNIESTLNAIFNKRIKEKYGSKLLYAEINAQAWQHKQKKNFEQEVAKIYELPNWNWDRKILNYLSERHTYPELRKKYDKESGEVIKTRTIDRTLTKMDIIQAYIWSKNDVLEKRLINQFGEDTLYSMFDEMSLQDVKLAELLMSTAQSFYPLVNKTFIRKYGVDLPKVSCYFPSTPERGTEIDLFNEYSSKSLGNSFTKSRAMSETQPMDFHNPVATLYSHIDGVSKFVFMSEILDEMNLRFKDTDLQRVITNKYGEDAHKTLMQLLANVTYKKEATVFSGLDKILDTTIGNWITGNIAIKPIVGLKQLLSANNYAVDMPYMTWQKGFLKSIADYKNTIDYMMNIPYIKARYEGNFSNEFLKQQIENSAFAASKKLKDLCTIFVKIGDIGAIVFGGKPYIDYLINEKGLTEQEAIKQFVLSTNRSQQSSAISSLSNFQVKMTRNPIGKLFIAFKNSPQQYVRMCADAVVSATNGDMTVKQCAKVIFQYAYVQPLLYTIATSGSLFRFMFTGDDDDLKNDFFTSIFNLNADALPMIGDIYRFALQKAFNQKALPQSTPLLGDIQTEISRLAKEGANAEDYLQAISYLSLHVGLGYNPRAIITMSSGVGDVANGRIKKGSMKIFGYTDKRAERITNEK